MSVCGDDSLPTGTVCAVDGPLQLPLPVAKKWYVTVPVGTAPVTIARS